MNSGAVVTLASAVGSTALPRTRTEPALVPTVALKSMRGATALTRGSPGKATDHGLRIRNGKVEGKASLLVEVAVSEDLQVAGFELPHSPVDRRVVSSNPSHAYDHDSDPQPRAP